MKTKPFLALSIVTASFFALTLLVSSVSNAQENASEDAAVAAEETPDDVSWDDNAAPGPKRFGDRPDGRPPMRGDRSQMRPLRDGDRPAMDRPPMPGSREGFRQPDFGRPEGPNHGNMMLPPPPAGTFQNWDQMEKSDPELFKLLKQDAELERTTRQLTMQYRQTVDEDAKAEIGAQLAETIAKHFDVRQKRRALELERLEKELNRMKDLFEKRNQSRDKIIEQRLKELKGEEESLF